MMEEEFERELEKRQKNFDGELLKKEDVRLKIFLLEEKFAEEQNERHKKI